MSDEPIDPALFQPLRGIRVIDFTRLLAGPYATMTLAELGADVIKIEKPDAGDDTRAWGPPFVGGDSAYFHAINRGKRSVALDLTREAERQQALSLIAGSDVVVESFRPGVAERLGIGPETLTERFPHLVYASISGFSPVGPMSAEPGTAVTVEAESGLMQLTGYEDSDPVRSGVAMIDIATGMSMINGVLAALLERTRTGRGRRIEVSLFATALSSLGTVIASASAGGPAPRPWGSGHPSIVPYRAFAAADGHAVLGATNDPMFARLATALDMEDELGREQWRRNEGRVRDRETLEALLAARLAQLSVDEIAERLQRHRVLIARVRRADEAAHGAQAAAMGMVFEDDGVLIARSALGTNGTAALGRAPRLGEHNAELLG
ncbi:CaiB/BaiF CoA transferase family protein [Microbacterium murale]|uniref:Crotonobetainyl-CoA:carnitine CoA-transferase CaiB-like acyl-CoA transferase n=1 Tax=Microbacterium murale TaxID=1081040 RepID=A0ABU0P5V0_9MICO|nr:CoA transferase [Microbacterium murale]MDQ0642706.1 crotonobetainyl-CoA:carnitine CoA-transferase CaiB-like acyl-CoA transferase [Microbacterium murale]